MSINTLPTPFHPWKLYGAAAIAAALVGCSGHPDGHQSSASAVPAASGVTQAGLRPVAQAPAASSAPSALAPTDVRKWDATGEDVLQESRAQGSGFDAKVASQLGFRFSSPEAGCEMKGKALVEPHAPRQMWAIASVGAKCDKRGGQWLQIVTRGPKPNQQEIFNAGAASTRLGKLAVMLVQAQHMENQLPELSLGYDSALHGRIWQRYAYDGSHYVLLDEEPKFALDAASAQVLVISSEGGDGFGDLPKRFASLNPERSQFAGRLLKDVGSGQPLWVRTCVSSACSGSWGSAMSLIIDGAQPKRVLDVEYAMSMKLDPAYLSHGLPRAFVEYQSGSVEEYEFDGQTYQVKAWH